LKQIYEVEHFGKLGEQVALGVSKKMELEYLNLPTYFSNGHLVRSNLVPSGCVCSEEPVVLTMTIL
jgi:hypothetical protein